MKKYIKLIAIVFVCSLVLVGVNARNTKAASEEIINRFSLSQGWNLMYGLQDPMQIISASDAYVSPPTVEEIRSDIELIYVYDSNAKKYVLLYAKRGTLESGEYKNFNPPTSIAEDIPTSVMWVFSEKTHSIKYRVASPPPLSQRKISAGWNFIPVFSDIQGKSINEIKGSCSIDALYTYAEDDGITQWINLKNIYDFNDKRALTEAPILGLQLVIKVTNNCQMGI